MSKIAVILITYNGEKWLQKCLESIFQSSVPVSVYICDNASTDGTISLLKRYPSCTEVLLLKQNIGFGAANNLCIKKAFDKGADYFFLLNQDVYINSNTIETLKTILTHDSHLGILSPLHLNGTGMRFDKNFLSHFTRDAKKDFLNDLYFGKSRTIYEASFVNAACWMLPRRTFEKIGGFDLLFFHYSEDENYCQRVLFHGFTIAVSTQTTICHDRDDRNGGIREEFQDSKHFRRWLLKVADVNNQYELYAVRYLKYEFAKLTIKSLFKLHLKRAYKHLKEFQRRKHMLKIAILHKKKNQQVGLHWLN